MAIAGCFACFCMVASAHALSIAAGLHTSATASCDSTRFERRDSACVCEVADPSKCKAISRQEAQCPNGTQFGLCESSGRAIALRGEGAARAHARQRRGGGANAILFTPPKTGSTTAWVAFDNAGVEPIRYHFVEPHDDGPVSDVRECGRDTCLVVSTLRKPGLSMISLFFQDIFGTWDMPDCGKACKEKGIKVLGMSPGERLEAFFKAAPRLLDLYYRRAWSKFSATFKASGYGFNMEKIRSMANQTQANARMTEGNMTWHFLWYDEIDGWEAAMRQYVPDWTVKHTLNSDQRVYKSQYHEMREALTKQENWPRDLWQGMMDSETMQLFFPHQMPV